MYCSEIMFATKCVKYISMSKCKQSYKNTQTIMIGVDFLDTLDNESKQDKEGHFIVSELK